jgi:alkanesulfonate monooxygenase SsuD/methylene tetrahydromethanopterin reductase-like flavin-dependent oxidoreductase (luciferase family)
MGSLPVLQQHVINQTKHLKVGPIGYVLAGWNPLRLVLEIAWLDQLTQGRIMVGFARGYQARWLNQMAQKLHVGATISDKSETDRTNREAFEEVFQILKLAWKDEPFRFKGKYYEYPYPYEEGTPWLAHEWTRQYGAPGEVDELGQVQMIDIVPKPYQKPHPPIWVGGETAAAMRRVAEFGDGWHIALLTIEQIRSLYERLRGAMDKAGRDFTKLEFTAMTDMSRLSPGVIESYRKFNVSTLYMLPLGGTLSKFIKGMRDFAGMMRDAG